jgi:hypothetical protein
MPVSWTISEGLAYFTSYEHGTLEEWMRSVDALLADPDYTPGMGVLHDRRRIANSPSSQEVSAAVAFIEARASAVGNARWALVASSTAGYGMDRMAQMLLQGTSVTLRVFHELGEAEDWVRRRAEADEANEDTARAATWEERDAIRTRRGPIGAVRHFAEWLKGKLA